MKLIFIHGAPAAGKLTTGQALLRIVAGRLFDNHAAIDTARTVFDFGAPGFSKLVHDVRFLVLNAAGSQGVPLVVTTYCYADPEDLPEFEQFEAVAKAYGGELLPVFLDCSKPKLIQRISNPDRVARRKTSSEQGLDKFISQYTIGPVPRANCLKLSSDVRSADENAQEIATHFNLL